MTFDSVYEMFKPLDELRNQHFWDWFSGYSLDSKRWTSYGNTGHTVAMDDAVDGGLYLQAGTSDNDYAGIGFGGTLGNDQAVRPFSHNSSKIIFVQKFSANGEYQASASGFDQKLRGDALGAAESGAILVTSVHNGSGKWVLRTGNGSDYSGYTYVTSSSMDTDWHVFSIECKSSSAELTIDGVTEATSTTYLPTARMGISFGIQSEGSATAKTNINYCEAYNT
jgi:hypothetical protein